MVRLELLTESRSQAARRCLREEYLRYVLGVVPVGADAEALRFGTLGHFALEARWRELAHIDETFVPAVDPLGAALVDVNRRRGDFDDEYERVRLEELLRGYCLRWENDAGEYRVLGVEREFRGPLLNPETGAASRTFERGGKLDVLVETLDGMIVSGVFFSAGAKLIVEHKFSGEDITQGSSFWARLKMGGQASGYIRGAELLGHQVAGVLYDVIAKVKLRPLKATPVEDRQYTIPKFKQCPFCKKKSAPPAPHDVDGMKCEEDPEGGPRRLCTDRGGKLYANQRDRDETPNEYRERVRADIAERPNEYFQRGIVVRLEDQMREHDLEAWQLASQLREYHRLGVAPRNPDACQRYASTCGYFAACVGEASIDSHLYRRLDWKHPELTKET
jgi:hypothetical protein